MAQDTRQDFIERMAAYIERHFAERAPNDLRPWLSATLDRCHRHAVADEPEAAQLILFMLVLGLDTDRTPWIRAALEADLLPLGKLRRLLGDARQHGRSDLDEMVVHPGLEDHAHG